MGRDRNRPTDVVLRRLLAAAIDLLLLAGACTPILISHGGMIDLADEAIARADEHVDWDLADVPLLRTGLRFAGLERIPYVDLTGGLLLIAVTAAAIVLHVVLTGLVGFSVGKLVAGVRVVGAERRPIGLRRSIIRALGTLLDLAPWVFLPGLIGAVSMLLSPSRQRVADRLAGCWVIRRPPSLPQT